MKMRKKISFVDLTIVNKSIRWHLDFDFVKMDEPSSEQDVSYKTPVAEDFNLQSESADLMRPGSEHS